MFKKFYTNSSATSISIPSMMTGVAPYEDTKKLHTMPLIWNWARAVGYMTLLISPQRYNWAAFHQFLLVPGPDYYATALQMDLPIVHDLGVDDLGAVGYFERAIEKIPVGKPFVAVYNSNALHEPYQETSKYLTVPTYLKVRHEKALYILDKTFEKTYAIIEKQGLLDTTIFMFTADHASYPNKKGIPRVFSFYHEALNIPFMMRMPSLWIEKNLESVKNLHANENKIASNIDVVPTLVSLLGLEKNNQPILALLEGKSLCRPLPPRYTIILNTNDINRSEHEGFGIYWEDRSFVFSTIEGPRFFDTASDPAQDHDIWGTADAKEQVLNIVNTVRHLKRVFQKFAFKPT